MDRLARMFDTHPEPASDAGEQALKAVRETAECSLVCTTCADACLAEAADMANCIRLCLDAADMTAVVAQMLARPGHQDRETLQRALEACSRACQACAEECERHADRMEHCGICAESCRACADACDRMTGALVA
ncbi:MAG TPA: four-helix bundle copper-binding protein [Alphaproteobacteria bacterium]|nr:four-helix bundle copper-binding protein [Alphaproteobacteria bacterium]